MKILVTGASGFIGGAIASRLSDHGHHVIGTGRTLPGWLSPKGSRYLSWDLFSAPPVDSVDVVVHCAALVDDQSSLAKALRINRDGTLAVRKAFPDARMVLLSSSSVYDSAGPHHHVTEDAALGHRLLGSYALSKFAAERAVAEFSQTIALRPHAVYGPGDNTLLPRIEAAVRGNSLALPRGGQALHALTHIDNLCAAVSGAVLSSTVGVFNITDAEPLPLATAITELLNRRGRSPVIRPVSLRLALTLAAGAERLPAKLRSRSLPSSYAVHQLAHEHTYSLERAKQQLGYDPLPSNFSGAEHW
ncbi:NAD-dependent epimerase/dehydratase family protein [Psychromicrobium lacuslunae]|uniref:NAD-dependent epimerase/dehydratase domain-containing protein n=1 Tax=Psychromicrobium lacuslunae TaxID=1618207 RepID=A0A0D4BYF8_9MICC|nr:NAD(P)-dependent oxidoreductase [Psychromicrobium lacuslunae]AJT41155.1 hypothetical protein UM93_05835 [Psychromicrobium lacuslunae]